MQKFFYVALFVIAVPVFHSCRNSAGKTGDRIAQVNYWYSRQSYFSPVNTDSAYHYTLLLDSVTKDLPPVYQAMALIGKGRYYSGSKPDFSKKMYEEALVLLNDSGADSIIARAYNGIGVHYNKRSDYSNALDNYFKALRLFEKSNDFNGWGGVLANIGEVYQVKNDIPSAKKYILRSMELNKKSNNINSYLDAAQTLANIYGMNNQFDSAMAIDRMGIAASDSIGSTRLKSPFYNNLGNCYMYSNRPDSALYYFTQCVALDSANGIINFMIDNYLTLGQLSLRQKKFREAEQYFKRTIRLSDSIAEQQLHIQAWKDLALMHRQEGNLEMALVAKDSAAAIKDRMINERSENKIAELQELYETDKKEQTIALQQVKLSKQQLLLTGSGVLLASLILSGWLLYRRYKIKKARELQTSIMQQREKATLDILQAEDRERRRIAAELHDGVGQVMLAAWINLQALEPQMNELGPSQQQAFSKAITMVGDGCREVREVSHAMMPNTLLNKGLEGAVNHFTQQIDPGIIDISLHTEGMDKPLDDLVETILYRVIQESVNNTIRHAGASELDISLHNNTEGVSLLIEDNGKGFDMTAAANDPAFNAGLGLKNIQSRIAFLQGTVEWDSSPGNGTVTTIYIPAKNKYA
jgi:two-component system, NarL family, sensor kinase